MDKLKYIKLEQPDGSYSDSIPLSVDGNYVDVNGNTLIYELNNKATKVDISNLNNKINSVTSGSPAGTYSTVSDLTSEDPDHSKIYLIISDGKWYYYDNLNSLWTAGGIYQSTGINVDNSLDVPTLVPNSQIVGNRIKLLNSVSIENFDSTLFEIGGIADGGTNNNNHTYRFRSKALMYAHEDLKICVPLGIQGGYHTYNADGSHINWSGWQNTDKIIQFTVPKNTYFRLIFKRVVEDATEVIDFVPIVKEMVLLNNRNENQDILNTYTTTQLDTAAFINADISSSQGNLNTAINYRIASHYIFSYPEDTTIIIPYGYRIGYHIYNSSTLAWVSWSGWTNGYDKINIPANTSIRLAIAKINENTSQTLDIDTTLSLYKVQIASYDNFLSQLLQSYGSTIVTTPSSDYISFNFGSNYLITISVSGNRLMGFLPTASNSAAFKTINLTNTTFDIPNNSILVLDKSDYTINVKTQAEFLANKDKFVILCWNSYGNIKGQFLIEYLKYKLLIDEANIDIANNESTIKITNRQGQVDNYPSNCLQSFKKAKKFGYNHIRASIGWTSDNIAICSHTDQVSSSDLRNLDGTTISDTSLYLSNLTYEYITENYDAGIYKGSQFAGYKVPKIEDVLKQAKKLNQAIDLEYKFGYSTENLESLLEMIYKLGLQDVTLYTSTSATQLYDVKNSTHKIKIGLIDHLSESAVNNAITLEADRLDIFSADTYDEDLILLAHENGIKVKVGSSYDITTAIDYINKYDVIECANQINPIYIINRE